LRAVDGEHEHHDHGPNRRERRPGQPPLLLCRVVLCRDSY
jgi:hypothetical protein